jgi:hypothetical protein
MARVSAMGEKRSHELHQRRPSQECAILTDCAHLDRVDREAAKSAG